MIRNIHRNALLWTNRKGILDHKGSIPTFFGVSHNWEPKDIVGCILWLRGDLGITKDGSNLVSAWADQSGSGNNLSAKTGGIYSNPLYVASGLINNKPCIRLVTDPSITIRQGFTVASTFIAIPCTSFVVFQRSSQNKVDVQTFFCMAGGLQYDIKITTVDNAGIYRNGWIYGTDPVSDDVSYLLGCKETNYNAITMYLNGAPNTMTAGVGYYAGITTNEFFTDQWHEGFSGDIAEVIVYNTALSSTNIDLVESYISTRYNITMS